MEILINGFYILCFLFCIGDIYLLKSSKKVFDSIEVAYKYRKVTGNFLPQTEFSKYSNYNDILIKQYAFILICVLFLNLIGLLSSDWILFLINIVVYLLFRLVVLIWMKIGQEFSAFHYCITLFSQIIRISVLSLIVINHFHKNKIYDYFTA